MPDRKVTITIRRPEGHTEIVDVTNKFPQGLWDAKFEQVKQNTADAGRGECLSYTSDVVLSAQEQADHDAHQAKAAWFAKHGFNGDDIS